VVSDRDGQIAGLNQAAGERDVLVDQLNHVVSDRDGQIAGLNQAAGERDVLVDRLNHAVSDRDGQIAGLNQAVGERDVLVDQLNHVVSDRDGQIAGLHQTATDIFASLSWRITAPLRSFKDILPVSRKSDYPRNFNALWYLQQHPDVAASGMNPYEHYRTHGKNEGRQPRPPSARKKITASWRALSLAVKQAGGVKAAARKSWLVIQQQGVMELFKILRDIQKISIESVHSLSLRPYFSAISFDPLHGYRMSSEPIGYTYIPPRRPPNFDRQLSALEHPTLFSIVVPIYNTPPSLLQKLLNSVTAQWYPHWELILADDASPDAQVQADLAKIRDPRIIVSHLPSNQGIAGATNFALALAKGEFVVLLDHDDELTEDCLFELAMRIGQENPDYIYSDEDKIAEDGRFVEPHFKPDWSPDTMMSTMYVCHVSCIRRSLLEKLGGLRSDYDGCQDWDLILRLAEKTNRISHIPKVLYHWRIIPASTAADIGAKPYVIDASKRVREDALKRRGLSGSVEPVEQVKGYFRVNYGLVGTPLISIIIPSRDNSEVLRRCLDSIEKKSSYRHYEIIILDNGSVETHTKAYLDNMGSQENITVIRHDAPFNFSELNNIGVNRAAGEILLFLNDDTEVISSDWLERMAGYATLSHIGAVGAKLVYPGGHETQHAGVVNFCDGPNHAFLHQNVDAPCYYMRNLLEYNWIAVTGACLMLERKKFLSVAGFDKTFPIAYNDIDLCFRLHDAGLYNIVCQAVRLVHHESVSRGLDHLSTEKLERLEKEKRRLYDKHPRYFQNDPFHNPNLHPNGINFERAV
jgi:GT2 family glycosyltransferase